MLIFYIKLVLSKLSIILLIVYPSFALYKNIFTLSIFLQA